MKEDYYVGSDVEYEVPKEQKSKKNSSNEDGEKFNFFKNKKVMFIIGAVVLMLFLIIIVSCSNGGEKSVNNNLGGINIINGEITPIFDAGVLEYSVLTTEDSVELSCFAENSKAMVNGCGNTIHLQEECIEHVVNVISESGMPKDYTFTICKQSKEAPIITDVKLSTENFTNDNIIVSVIVESKNDLHEAAYSFDGGNNYQASNEYALTENKILEIKVRDIYENVSATYPKKINLIDRTTPTVSIKGSVASGNQTSSNVVLTSFVEPGETLSGYTYQWYKNNIQILNATKSTYTATSSGNYKVEVKTGSGNIAISTEYNVNKISTTKNNNTTTNNNITSKTTTTKKPTVTISSVGGNPSSWTKSDVKLTINASASLGLHDKPYSFDNGKTYTSSKSMSFSKNQDVNIVVRDKNGNTTSYVVYITKIDKTKPTVTISGNTTVGSKLTAKVSPTSTPSGYKYQWYKESSAITGATSSSYTANTSGNYFVKVTTGAGNSTSSSTFTVKPNKPGNVTLKSTVTQNAWTNHTAILTADVTNGTAKNFIWQKNGGIIKTTTTNTYTIDYDTNDSYSVKVEFTNGTSTTSNKINLKIDKTGPTVPSVSFTAGSSSYTANGSKWINKDVLALPSASDSSSGIKNYEYSSGCTGNVTSSLAIGAKLSYQNEGTFNTCFRAVDNVGNRSDWTSKYTVQIDKTSPYTSYIPDSALSPEFSCYSNGNSISPYAITRDYKYCYGHVTSTYKVYIADSDGESGIDSCEYVMQDDNGISYGGSLGSFEENGVGKYTGYNTITWKPGRWPSQTLPTPDVTKRGMVYLRRCYDKAGNVSNAIFLFMY